MDVFAVGFLAGVLKDLGLDLDGQDHLVFLFFLDVGQFHVCFLLAFAANILFFFFIQSQSRMRTGAKPTASADTREYWIPPRTPRKAPRMLTP